MRLILQAYLSLLCTTMCSELCDTSFDFGVSTPFENQGQSWKTRHVDEMKISILVDRTDLISLADAFSTGGCAKIYLLFYGKA